MSNLTKYSLDDRVIGASYIVMCVGVSATYLPCMWVIGRDVELKNLSCLRMMFHVGVSELIILLSIINFGILSFTGIAYSMPYWISNVSGMLFIFGWQSYCFLVSFLSFNRCVHFCLNPTWHERLFGTKATMVWVILGWLGGCLFLAIYMTPYTTLIYIPNWWIVFYDMTLPFTLTMMKVVDITCGINLACVAICYSIIFVSMKFQLTSMGTIEDPETRATEKSLLIQCLIICLSGVVTDRYWHNGIETACNNIGIYCYPIGIWLHIINCAINPLVYLTLNKTIATKVKKMFKKTQSVHPATSATGGGELRMDAIPRPIGYVEEQLESV